jgi:hypothetical protein
MHVTDKSARLIVLVDGENFPAKLVERLLEDIRRRGSVVETRVYGHFDAQTTASWKASVPSERLTHVNVRMQGKNSTDFLLTIEAIDILHTRHVDGICIASSDEDFSSLAHRIKATAVRAYGFGEKKAKEEYRACFDEFVVFDGAKKPTTQPVPKAAAKTTNKPRKPSALKPSPDSPAAATLTSGMVRHAISHVKRNTLGWAPLQQVGDFLHKTYPALPKVIRLLETVQNTPEFEVLSEGKSHFVRGRTA